MRVLIVEDSPERQKILTDLYGEHAWVLTHTARRAAVLLASYTFDIISLDYDLAGPEKGDAVAEAIRGSASAGALVVVHSMNSNGARRICEILPDAALVPLSKITRNNVTFRRLQEQLRQGRHIDWGVVFRKVAGKEPAD